MNRLFLDVIKNYVVFFFDLRDSLADFRFILRIRDIQFDQMLGNRSLHIIIHRSINALFARRIFTDNNFFINCHIHDMALHITNIY